jgi:benzylsuccinate CoA-transferase BbsF subunit
MEIMDQCQAAGCPITAVFTVAEAAEHPHLKERGYLVELDHDALGVVRLLGAPFKLSATPGGPERAAPRLGEHNDEILGAGSAGASPPAGKTVTKGGALPLEGLRVANFGWVWAGPVVGQTLSFLGAEVYKIESYARVDMTRNLPPFAEGEAGPNRSLSNHACWAGNGSVSLNLKKEEGRRLALELIAKSDVVIENFGPGVMEQFGLGYEELRKVKPDIIMFSMPAAGLYGPLKNVRTYGLSLTSTTGLDSLTGYDDGPPIPVENAYSDPYNGIFGAFAVLTAVAHHRRTGEGQQIDFSQQEAVMQMVGPAFMDYTMNGRVAGPIGNRHPLAVAAPHGVFPCSGDDRWISIACMTDGEWEALVRAMGAPEWAGTADYATLDLRVRNIGALHEALSEWTAGFEDRALAERLQSAGVPATPVLDVSDLLSDPQFHARETFVEVEHPLGFRETIYGAYVKTSRTKARIRPGPWIGQDNDHVFLELLGLEPDRYRALQDDEVIY